MKPVIIGLIALVGYSMFLGIKSILYYWLNKERKTAVISISMFILVPVLLYLAALIPEESNLRLWVGAPVVIMGAYWGVAGFFMDGAVKKAKESALKAKDEKALPKPSSPKWRLKQIIILIFSLLIWSYGAFWGVGNTYLAMAMLCLSIFLFAFSLSALWRWREF